ncbi:MAG TPA: glucan biosynthesis protein G [Steroidobacteraceae bacterium]|nr:glucan biosynthesis protein G [Steroidobacteraceae bacterium]
MIAVLLLASAMLSIESTDRGAGTPRNTQAAAEHKSVVVPPLPQTAPPAQPGPFAFADVQQLARERAAHDYRQPPQNLPTSLANLTYDQYRDIRFRPASALWRGQALFEVQFFHRGYRVRQRVNVFEVTPAGAGLVEYSPRLFTFGRLMKTPKLSTDVGFAGFRIHYPLQSPNYKDELLVFLGASYFRVLGRNQHYGASARGLAIDTAAQSGEEFPTFTDFWLVRPQPSDRSLTIYALLDSRSVTGAYQFEVHPGEVTQVEVHCDLYPRRNIAKLGVAPLTSMFLYGEDGSGRRFDDFRPQVHDSDGLMNETGHGQWIWRPLANPRELRVNRFMDQDPRGFGLVQRDRNFAHYEDVESQYQSRPSYWVQPLGNWGKGGVELVEIPSDEEIHDNMVAYWVPDQPVTAGKPLSFAYLLSAFADNPRWPPGGRVMAIRSGNPAVGDNKGRFGPGARRMLIEFAGGELDGLDGSQPVKAELSADNGQIEALTVQRVPQSGSWRIAFVVTPRPKKPVVDLRCYLTLYGEVLTETWVYQWSP